MDLEKVREFPLKSGTKDLNREIFNENETLAKEAAAAFRTKLAKLMQKELGDDFSASDAVANIAECFTLEELIYGTSLFYFEARNKIAEVMADPIKSMEIFKEMFSNKEEDKDDKKEDFSKN